MHSRNTVSLYKFLANMFLVGVRKKHLHYTIYKRQGTGFSKHLERKCLYIPVPLRKKIFEKLLSGGEGWAE